ncbi:hypothetical protein SNEBB_010899 [Seison nebaliae]|nr:hypothetical protein SNEBB_010899 [Seison nebaliae]
MYAAHYMQAHYRNNGEWCLNVAIGGFAGGIVSTSSFILFFKQAIRTKNVKFALKEIKYSSYQKPFLLLLIGAGTIAALISYRKFRKREEFFDPKLRLSEIFVRSSILGTACGASTYGILDARIPWKWFFTYSTAVSLFHMTEFVFTALYTPRTLKNDSFLMSHSMHYHMAILLSCVEFFSMHYASTTGKDIFPNSIRWYGLAMILGGEILRKSSFVSLRSNFSHVIEDDFESRSTKDANLVTSGIFHYMRHPAYAGWLLWVMGGQLMLKNYCSLFFLTFVGWKFFQNRIRLEDDLLQNEYKNKFAIYRLNTFSGIPFIE